MNSPSNATTMPEEMLKKLQAVERRDRSVRVQTGLTRALAVLLTAMLAMMALDWIAAPHEGPWRWLMTLSAAACGVAALIVGCMIPVMRRRSMDSVAQDVDLSHPALEERFQTITGFANSKDAPDLRGSEGMIRKVAAQTAAMSQNIEPSAAVSKKGLTLAFKFLGAAVAVLALFFALDFQRAKVLAERFLQPSADITMTQLEAKDGDQVIGKGENVTLDFATAGKATDTAQLSMQSAAGRDEVVDIAKDAKDSTAASSKFSYTAYSVSDSFKYSARSGDGRTHEYSVTVLERPKLTGVQFRLESPAYSQIPLVNQPTLPRQIRALEGSKLQILFQPDQELATMDLKYPDGKAEHLQKRPDGKYEFDAVLSNNLAFEPLLVNARHLENQSPPDCDIIVYKDEPPTVTITSPSDEITARPDDKIQIDFEARDDFGLTHADLVVSVNNDNGSNAPPVVIPIHLQTNEIGSRLIRKSVQLDLGQFNLQQDQELSYSVRVTDTKNDSSFSTPDANATNSDQTFANNNPSSQNNNQPNQGQNGNQANQSNQNNGQNQGQQANNGQEMAQNQNQNQGQQNNGMNQSQADSQNQGRPNSAMTQSQMEMAQNQADSNQRDQGGNQSQQNAGQNQNQGSQNQNGANNPQQNGGQNQAGQNMAQNQSSQNPGGNQSQQNAGQNQQAQRQNGANSSQQNGGQNQQNGGRNQQNGGQNQSGQNVAQNQSQQNGGQNQSQQNQNKNQSNLAQNQANNGQSQRPNTAHIGSRQNQQNGGGNQSQSGNTAQNSSSQQNSGNQQNQNQGQNQPSGQDQNHIPMSSPNSNNNANNNNNSQTNAGGAQPPPNNMTKRALDVAGQSSSAQPMHIKVDEFARSFDGQMREKQELAIDPTLKLLDELLKRAHELTETNIVAANSKEGLGVDQTWALEESKEQIRQADRAAVDLKKVSTGTPYAFIGLQISDIADTHVAPAREELGEVTLESNKLKEDKDNLTQASFHIEQARKMLADLTKNYESVKRDNKLADAMQELKKMHQLFLEDTQAMLGSKKPPINQYGRKVAEVDDDYVNKLQKLMEEQKKIMDQLAKILADDPRMLRRFMAMQEADNATLRDQMTMLAERQKTLTKQTAEWTVADDTARTNLAREYLGTQVAEQSEISSLSGKMHENMITWLPDGVQQDQEPVATALNLAAEGTRFAGMAAAQASPDTISNSVDTARKALDQYRLLHDYLPDMSDDADTKNLSVYAANRLTEADDLVTKESGWVKKMEALRTNDFSQSVQVDEHQLAVDTQTLYEKLDAALASVAGISTEVHDKADQLLHTVQKQVIPGETRAVDSLGRKQLKDAVDRQQGADTAFAQAETQFDELMKMVIDKMDAAPPPDDPGTNPTLDQMLAMLQQEQKMRESLGIPNRPINVQVMRDWLRQSQGQGQGQGQQGGQQANGGRQNQARDRANNRQARDGQRRADQMSDQARRDARLRAAQMAGEVAVAGNGNSGGPKAPSNAWNTLASQLGDELKQSRDNIPPEQYRQAIEQYFNSISQEVPSGSTTPMQPANPGDAKDKNP